MLILTSDCVASLGAADSYPTVEGVSLALLTTCLDADGLTRGEHGTLEVS